MSVVDITPKAPTGYTLWGYTPYGCILENFSRNPLEKPGVNAAALSCSLQGKASSKNQWKLPLHSIITA